MRNFSKLALPASALALTASLYGCSSSEARHFANAVSLRSDASASEQARELQTDLNLGKTVTGVTVEIGYAIPVTRRQIPSAPRVIEVDNPIKVGVDTYVYANDSGNNRDLHMGVVRYTGKLVVQQLPKSHELVKDPHEAIVDVSADYSQTTDSSGTVWRYYVAGINKPPGDHYDDPHIVTAGQLTFNACDKSGCG